MLTTAGNLKAKYVVHTVGPIWRGGSKGEVELLESAYRQSLELVAENHLSSMSFPSISTGAYGYPVDNAARVALMVVSSFLRESVTSIKEVVFVLFGSRAFDAYSSALKEIKEGIN